MTTCRPGSSKLDKASNALADQGTLAPTKAQAIPSRKRYLARVRTGSGTSSKVKAPIHVQSWLVMPPSALYAADFVVVGDVDSVFELIAIMR